MNAQRLRNLTTGKLHTSVEHVYQDIEYLTGEAGIMTHHVPNATLALEPFLREKLLDERFWDERFDPTHVGDVAIVPMTEDESEAIFERFRALQSLI